MLVRNLPAIFLLFVCGFLVPTLPAQSPVPQSYTLTVSSGMALEAMSLNSTVEAKVSRFGPREFVDVTTEQKTGQVKAIHARHWFDLIAHKAYSLDVVKNTCSWISYTTPDMPVMYDPLATPAPSAEDLAAFNKNVVRQENINGIAARLSESSSEQGKSSIWVAVNGNYPLKAVLTLPGAQPVLMLEVKELHFVKPDIALLTPPVNCTTHVQGEWTEVGMSVQGETTIDANGSGSVDLKTGKATVKSSSQPH